MDSPTLGNGDNRAVIYERGGGRRLFTLPGVASLEWNRNLDAISRATVTCTPTAASQQGLTWTADSCAGLLSTINPWAHELVIYRNDARVWEGPIRRPRQSRGGVIIDASDVLGHTERRVVTAPRAGDVAILTEAVGILTAAFTADDPDVLAHVTALGSTAAVTTIDTPAASGYYSAALLALVDAGLYVTVVGRRIVLWADTSYILGRTAILNPVRHLVGDLETAREGDELATRAWAANDVGEYAADGATDPFYGLVERIAPASSIVGPPALAAAAATWRKPRATAPETLTIPDGSTLHCDAPFPIEALIPGVLTPVKVTDLCWPVDQTMLLTAVKVSQDAAGETVAVSYAPITGDESDGG